MKPSTRRHKCLSRDSISKETTKAVVSHVPLCLAVAFLLVEALGCAARNDPLPGKIPVFTSGDVRPAPTPELTPVVVSPNLSVSGELAAVCNVDFDDIESAPKFDFARSNLLKEDSEVLSQIARCVTTGTLAGRALVLVGRADPRGESEYNMVLGEERATSVRTYLLRLGIAPSKVRSTSRGKLDATGSDELGWLRDRRVDVSLR